MSYNPSIDAGLRSKVGRLSDQTGMMSVIFPGKGLLHFEIAIKTINIIKDILRVQHILETKKQGAPFLFNKNHLLITE